MEESELRLLIAGRETLTVEFKTSFRETDLVEAVVCLANRDGGNLLIGVTDDGQIVGVKPKHRAKADPRRVEAHIANNTDPWVQTSAEIVSVGDADVLVIQILRSDSVVATKRGKYLHRVLDVHGNPECRPMSPHEVMARMESMGKQDYSRAPFSGLDLKDLSGRELDRFRELARSGGDRALASLSDLDLLKALHLTTRSGQLTVGALLLFGAETALRQRLPNHEVAFHELEGLEVRTAVVLQVPLLRAMTKLADYVSTRNTEEEVEVGLTRIPLPRYSDEAIRELIANALVHRDYRAIGSTLVQMQSDVLTISNPGGLPAGVTTANLLTIPPTPRNPALADAFKRAGLVERTGRGINRAYAAQLSLGRPAPDYSRSSLNLVVARVKAGPADKELAAFIAEARGRDREFSLEDLLVLHEIRAERQITTARAAELFQVGSDEARLVLNKLADSGYLEARGHRKGRYYHLAASLYERLGQPAHYVRARGFDVIQQEQMVNSYVTAHGSITRREAAELCQIDASRAGRLLRRMRDEGKLILHGAKRTARYELP